MGSFFDLATTGDLLARDFVQQAVLALALLGLLGGLLSPLIVARQMSFAVHGVSELSVTGAAAALLAGVGVNIGGVIGAVIAALTFGFLGNRARERDSVIGVVMAFGLGLAVLFLALYGNASKGFAMLTGQVVSVGISGLTAIAVTTGVVIAVLAVIYRPLLFASVDPRVAMASGVPTRTLSIVFAVLMGLACAQGVQIIGALLVMSLLITPGAAAMRVSSNPAVVTGLAILFAEIAAVGGLILSLAPGLPVSVFVTTISFVIYLVCRYLGRNRAHGQT
ncbi:metal ABC transporter permease [Gordonia defluvii]|uniref:Metal ABC transporter permease n=1 Tax=Gordonia defluvii TaxID=283718 RepID=A0ABP6LKY4_9ACTN|nr:metal ABC transporter permease [Gordonia sp. UBA5067]